MVNTLEELRQVIENEIPFIDIKPYSHNIISITLRIINDEYGEQEAVNIIADNYELQEKGWGYILEETACDF